MAMPESVSPVAPSPADALPAAWLTPLPLTGGHALPNRILPGPMEGLTGPSLCQVYARRSLVGCWIVPFIRVSRGVPRAATLRRRLEPYTACGLPFMVQVMGTDIDLLAETAARLCRQGALGVDLNCACPSRAVVSNGAGGARLRDPDWIAAALRALRAACPAHGVSVKLRSGFVEPAELPEILAAVTEADPDFAILHFRTVQEEYRPVPAGCERLAQARVLAPGLKLIASGDLFSAGDALDVWRRANVDGVAPARGLLRNPRLLREIEAACRGAPGSGVELVEPVSVLLDIAREGLRRGTTKSGFVVEIAKHMFGPESRSFQRLSRHNRLAATVSELEAMR